METNSNKSVSNNTLALLKLYLVPTRRKATVCWCLPLAVAGLLAAFAIFTWGIFDMTFSASRVDKGWPSIEFYLMGFFKIATAICSGVAILYHRPGGARILYVACIVHLVSMTIKFLTQWYEWTLAMTGNSRKSNLRWHPTKSDVTKMVFYTLKWFAFCLVAFIWIMSIFASLEKVMAVGGTGMENENYLVVAERLKSQEFRRLSRSSTNKSWKKLETRNTSATSLERDKKNPKCSDKSSKEEAHSQCESSTRAIEIDEDSVSQRDSTEAIEVPSGIDESSKDSNCFSNGSWAREELFF